MRAVLVLLCSFLAVRLSAESALVTQRVFRDAGRVALVDTSATVEACLLSVDDPSNGTDLKRRRFVEGRYRRLPEEVRTLIAWKLLDDASYRWDALSSCIPTYAARVRFVANGRTVDVDFCFDCSLMRILEDGAVVGGGYFEPGSDWVFQALAIQFPKERVVRDHKKRREQAELVRLQIEMAKARDARNQKANQ